MENGITVIHLMLKFPFIEDRIIESIETVKTDIKNKQEVIRNE